MSKKCSICGFSEGETVVMKSGIVNVDTQTTIGEVKGIVQQYEYGCHIVDWPDTGCVTRLPNPNVRHA